MSDKIKGYVPKAFRDSGTGERFEGGKEHEFEVGAHANYVAAGKIKEKPKGGKTENAPADPKSGATA